LKSTGLSRKRSTPEEGTRQPTPTNRETPSGGDPINGNGAGADKGDTPEAADIRADPKDKGKALVGQRDGAKGNKTQKSTLYLSNLNQLTRGAIDEPSSPVGIFAGAFLAVYHVPTSSVVTYNDFPMTSGT
jgi:hypothetical protein